MCALFSPENLPAGAIKGLILSNFDHQLYLELTVPIRIHLKLGVPFTMSVAFAVSCTHLPVMCVQQMTK